MNAPAWNLMRAIRRFVDLRSAGRRSLALEPRDTPPCPPPRRKNPPPDGCCGCCHA